MNSKNVAELCPMVTLSLNPAFDCVPALSSVKFLLVCRLVTYMFHDSVDIWTVFSLSFERALNGTGPNQISNKNLQYRVQSTVYTVQRT